MKITTWLEGIAVSNKIGSIYSAVFAYLKYGAITKFGPIALDLVTLDLLRPGTTRNI